MYLVTVTQMKRTLNNWKYCWQEDFTEEKASSKVIYPSFFSIAMKLETSKKIEEKMMEETIEKKAKSHATLLMNKTLMKMMMKLCMLQ